MVCADSVCEQFAIRILTAMYLDKLNVHYKAIHSLFTFGMKYLLKNAIKQRGFVSTLDHKFIVVKLVHEIQNIVPQTFVISLVKI